MNGATWPTLARKFAKLLVPLMALSLPAAAADTHVALIESVTGVPPGVEDMDYVSAGRVISLHANQSFIIDYFGSCLRETIVGGVVTVGTERSGVKGGTVERERVRCDGGHLQLAPEQPSKSAGAVFRVPPKSPRLPSGTVIEHRLYGASPIFDLGGENHLIIERLDRKEDPLDLVNLADRLKHGRFYDFAEDGRTLSPGAVYRVTVGERSVVFQIDRTAKPGKTPLAGRLLRF